MYTYAHAHARTNIHIHTNTTSPPRPSGRSFGAFIAIIIAVWPSIYRRMNPQHPLVLLINASAPPAGKAQRPA